MVYVFVHAKENILKIGRTESAYKRFKELSKDWGEFDIDKSFIINCKHNYSSRLESMLHSICADHKIHFGKSEKCGHTEFFHGDVYKELKNFIENVLPSLKKGILIREFRETYEYGVGYDMHKRAQRLFS